MAVRVLLIRVCPSICLFVLLSCSFLGNGLLVFFWNFACMVQGAYMCGTEPDFFLKILFGKKLPKMIKNDPKMGFLDFFREIYLLVLSGNSWEWKYLWPFSILQKLIMWEKSGFQVLAKNALGQSNFSIL